MQHVLRDIERHVGAGDLDGEDDEIDVIEEIEIGVPDLEGDRRVATGQGDAHLCDVGPAIDLDRRFAIGGHRAPLGAFAIEQALHIRQERHELAIMPFLESLGIGAELVVHLLPDPAALLQHLPVAMDLRALLSTAAAAAARAGSGGSPAPPAWIRRIRRWKRLEHQARRSLETPCDCPDKPSMLLRPSMSGKFDRANM